MCIDNDTSDAYNRCKANDTKERDDPMIARDKTMKHPPYVMFESYVKLAGYSLDDIANKLFQSRTTIRRKIGGTSDFTLTEAKLLEIWLNTSKESLFQIAKSP